MPSNAPPKFKNRSVLWNAVECAETRKNSQTAKHIDAALPMEISREEQIDLVRHFCMQCFVSKGMCADFAIHDKDDGNPHVHILITTRNINENGFTTKNRSWNDKSMLLEWRKLWADWCNHKLYYVNGGRIDHRSYKEQGVSKIPQKHLGAAACAIEKKGYRTDKGSHNRKVILANAETEIEQLNFKLKEINSEHRAVKKEIIETETECPMSELTAIDIENIPDLERFKEFLSNAGIPFSIQKRNGDQRDILFSKAHSRKVSEIWNALFQKKEYIVSEQNRDNSEKKHRSR